jgi:hypothetical protein
LKKECCFGLISVGYPSRFGPWQNAILLVQTSGWSVAQVVAGVEGFGELAEVSDVAEGV